MVSDPFCQEVLPQVEAFLEEGRSTNSVQDDAPYGGTVVVGGLAEIPNGMNAALTNDYVANQHQQFVNLMTLLDYDEALEPRPYLAESWEVSEDGRELTFRLRDDVRWHDGEPTDAHDVAFTYRLVTHPETGFPNVAFWDLYDRGDAGVEVLDDHTVRFRLEPHADFLDPWRAVAILPEHLLGDVPPAEVAAHPFGTRCPVGNGPFVFVEHRDQDLWRFAANPAFPEALGGRPYLDEYVYRIVPDANTMLLEHLAGRVDVLISAEPDDAPRIDEEPSTELRAYPFRNVTFIAWNTRRPILSDARVRRALTLGVDRQAIVDALLQGRGSVANGTVPPWHWAYTEAAGLPFDPGQAERLLTEAGWEDRDGDGIRENAQGTPLSISFMSNAANRRLERLGTIMQDQLADVGVGLRLELLEWGAMVGRVTDVENRDYDGAALSWATEFKVDDTDLFLSERVDGPYAFSGLQDPELDELLLTLPTVVDRDEARTLWVRYQERLTELQPFTFFYWPDRLDGVGERMENVVTDVRGEWVNIREWRIRQDS